MDQKCDIIQKDKPNGLLGNTQQVHQDNKSYNVNKRQIYVWTENKQFFDNLKNKSKFINLLIRKYREDIEDETISDGREA